VLWICFSIFNLKFKIWHSQNFRNQALAYTETKASILRRSKNTKPEVTQTVNNRISRKSTFNRQISSSLSDLREGRGGRESIIIHPEDSTDLKIGELMRQNSTPSNLGVWFEKARPFYAKKKYSFVFTKRCNISGCINNMWHFFSPILNPLPHVYCDNGTDPPQKRSFFLVF